MKHRAFTMVEFAVALGVVGALVATAVILFPTGCRSRESARRSSCQSNLKQIGLDFAQYTKDYDDKFPPIDNASGAMNSALTLYIGEDEARSIFQCPSTRGDAPNSTDYFTNARLAGADKIEIANPDSHISAIILAGDGEDDQLSPAYLKRLPDAWRQDENSPAYRHLDGANYLFSDGHVKWFKPDAITLDKPGKNHPTFLLGP